MREAILLSLYFGEHRESIFLIEGLATQGGNRMIELNQIVKKYKTKKQDVMAVAQDD